jgi:hypothetical protein
MKIDLTKKQFKELLLLASIGTYVKGAVEDRKGKYKDRDETVDYFLSHAKDFGLESLVDNFKGGLIESDDFSDKVDKMMEEYDEDEFWHRLVMYLGKRDFFRETTKDELAEIKKDEFGWLPKKIQKYYAKYENEFEEYGVERLVIDEDGKGIS